MRLNFDYYPGNKHRNVQINSAFDFFPQIISEMLLSNRGSTCWHCTTRELRTPDEAFFQWYPKLLCMGRQKQITFGVYICGQTISTILELWVPCPWENGFGCFSYKTLFQLLNTHTHTYIYTHPKYIPNMILALKNLGNSHHTSVVSGRTWTDRISKCQRKSLKSTAQKMVWSTLWYILVKYFWIVLPIK